MNITKVTRPYEVLIRYHQDGKIGVHFKTETIIRDGDEVISGRIDTPIPYSFEEFKAFSQSLTESDWYVPEVVEPPPVES